MNWTQEGFNGVTEDVLYWFHSLVFQSGESGVWVGL